MKRADELMKAYGVDSTPTMIIDAMRPATARLAPRLFATIGMMGTMAPSPTENSSVGSSAGSAIERKLNGCSC